MAKEILLDLSFLTEAERDLISNVISKDAEIRKAEQNRIGSLRKDLDDIKEEGLPEDQLESKNENYCARCQAYFGVLFNRGAYCPRCELKVCKVCRVNDKDDGWICTLCSKVREVKAQSGAWFFQGHKEKNGNLFGSMLVRQSLRRLPGSYAKPLKGQQESSNPFIEDEEPHYPIIKDEDALNPFTSGSHVRSSEKVNSNHAQITNGHHKMGYQYSDESEEESEQRSHDGSLEDNPDTISDRTHSRGNSDSSESLDSDHDETFETNDDELSPEDQAEDNVQPEVVKDAEDELVISKDTKDISNRPLTLNRYTDVNLKKSYVDIVPKKPARYMEGDDGTLKKAAEKTRSRPGSLNFDEDMSYVAAPRFNIPTKRRQSSASEDPAPKSEVEYNTEDRLDKPRSRSEENLLKNEGKLGQSVPMVECTNTSSSCEGEENISDVFEDIFETGKSNKKDGKIGVEAEIKFSPPDDFESEERETVGESLPQKRSQNLNMDKFIENNEGLSCDEEKLLKETEIAIESSVDLDEDEANTEQSNIKSDSFTDQEYEVSTIDDKKMEGIAITSHIPRNVDTEGDNISRNAVSPSDDDENTEKLSVLSRIKNWEHKSIEDRFGTNVARPRPTIDIGVEKEDKSAYGDQRKAIKNEYETSSESASEQDVADLVSAEEDEETQERRNSSPIVSGSLEDRTFTITAGTSADVSESSLRLDVELQQELNEKPDATSDNITPDHVIQNDIPSKDVDEISTKIEEEDEVELRQESNTDERLNNYSQRELMEDGKGSVVEAEMAPQLESRYEDFDQDQAMQSDLPSEGSTVETRTTFEEAENENQEQFKYDKDSDNVDKCEATENYFLPEDDKSSINLKRAEMVLEQESSDDKDLNNSDQGEAMKNVLPSEDGTMEHKSGIKPKFEFSSSNNDSSFKTGVNFSTSSSLKSDTFVDTEVPSTQTNYKEEKTEANPFDSEDDTPVSDNEKEALRDDEVHAEISTGKDTLPGEPYSHNTNMVQPAREEEPSSPTSRINAMRAFSETFVSTNLGLKRSESHEDRDTYEDRDTREDREYLEEEVASEGYEYRTDQHTPEEREQDEDTRVDRRYLAGQDTGEELRYDEKQHDSKDRETRGDRDYQEESEGPDSRRSSDVHYAGFQGDNESMISETSGYGTPTASEDTSSKRTPSISGDEGTNAPGEARRLPSESAPMIVTVDVDDARDKSDRNSSITEYEEDLDVSFSKFGAGLGNRKLKDQLSMGSRESIVSYYSNAGGEVYGKYPVSGEILFGIKYDPKIQEFQIQIHQARDITAVDKKSKTSDPYIKTYLLPDRSRTGKRKSKVKKHTVNPVFDEILTYKITYDEILQRTLWLAVWNHDSFGHNDFLGEVLVPIDEYHQSGFSLEDPEPQWYDLCERQAEDPQFSYNGEIVFALKYVPPSALVSTKKKKKKKKADEEKGELHINIIEASNLLAKDANGFSDPFCKSYLLPDKSKKTKQKTPVVKKSLNPKWNYHFIYDNVTHEELMDRVLELTIWDYDRGSSNEFLGGVRLGLGAGLQEWDDSTSEEQAAWNKMLNNQNDWNQVSLTLRDNMGSHKVLIKKRIGEPKLTKQLPQPLKKMTSAWSNGFFSNTDPDLMEIKPSRPPLDQILPDHMSPDEQLVRHHEYHSPKESKIAMAMRLSEESNRTPVERPGGTMGMTLAELARSSPRNKRESNASTPNQPAVSHSSLSTPHISTPEMITEGTSSPDSLVRHSEFYKGSTSVMRRPSSESALSFIGRERGGSTLSDLVQQGNVDNDSLRGSNLSVDEELLGSRESVYSNDGVYANHDVSGEILISYQYYKGSFKLKIFEARGLTAVDKTQNTSNPYVKVYLLPDQSRAGKRKTKIKHATLDPEFNEEMLFKISTADLLRRIVWVSVWTYDRFGRNEFLGEVRIPLGDYQGCEVAPDWYPLLPASTSNETGQGELVVALMYSPADKKRKSGQGAGKLYVKIIEAKNLQGKDADGLSDPFCKSYLLPDPQKKSKKKTPVKKRNLNPRWDYKFSYDNLTIDDLKHRALELTVWDHDLGTSNDFLGGVRIGLGTSDESWDDCTGEEVTLWQFLLSKPNTWAESTLLLRSEMGSRKGLRT